MYDYYEYREESELLCVQERLLQEELSSKDIISSDDILNLVIWVNTFNEKG